MKAITKRQLIGLANEVIYSINSLRSPNQGYIDDMHRRAEYIETVLSVQVGAGTHIEDIWANTLYNAVINANRFLYGESLWRVGQPFVTWGANQELLVTVVDPGDEAVIVRLSPINNSTYDNEYGYVAGVGFYDSVYCDGSGV